MMKQVALVLCAVILQVSCLPGLFSKVLPSLSSLPSVPTDLPSLDSITSPLTDAASALPDAASGLPDALSGLPDSLSGLPDALSALPDTLKALPDTVTSQLSSLLDDSTSALSSLPDSLNDGPLKIASEAANRAIEDMKKNVMDQLKDGTDKINEGIANITQLATDALKSDKIADAAKPIQDQITDLLGSAAPDSDAAKCIEKVKDDVDAAVKAAQDAATKCVTDQTSTATDALKSITDLSDDVSKSLDQSVTAVTDCISSLTPDAASADKLTASTCLVSSSGKIVTQGFTLGIQIATKISMNSALLQNAQTAIQNCIPTDLDKALNMEDLQKALTGCSE